MTRKRFVAWARVSSVQQKREGFSLEDQAARLSEFAQRLGGEVIQLFQTAETATKSLERKKFREFTTYVKRNSHRLDGMVFVKVDRAARNLHDWTALERLAEDTGVPFFFTDQPAGDNPAGRMQRRMSAVFASYQTDQQATDIRAGQKRRVQSGLPLGRQYGYRNIRVNGRGLVEIDPVQGPKVKRIFELFAYSPLTLESLADTLARQGIIYTDRTPRWAKSTLHRLLHNRIYRGEVFYDGLWHPGSIEPLVDLETFEAVRAKFGTDLKVYHKPQLTYGSGVLTCGHCGHAITGEHKIKTSPNGTRREYSYYRCSQLGRACSQRLRVTEADLDRELIALFTKMRIADDEVRQWFKDVLRARVHAGQHDNHELRVELQRQIEQVEDRLAKLLELRLEDAVTPDEYAAKRRELQDRQAGLRLQLQTTDVDERELADRAIAAFELSQSLCERWLRADYTAKRTILGIMLESARLNSNDKGFSLGVTVRKPFDVLADDRFVPITGAMGI